MVPLARPLLAAATAVPHPRTARSEPNAPAAHFQAWLIARVPSVQDERGASMVEYGLLVALIAVVVAVGAGILGTAIDAPFQGVAGQL